MAKDDKTEYLELLKGLKQALRRKETLDRQLNPDEYEQQSKRTKITSLASLVSAASEFLAPKPQELRSDERNHLIAMHKQETTYIAEANERLTKLAENNSDLKKLKLETLDPQKTESEKSESEKPKPRSPKR